MTPTPHYSYDRERAYYERIPPSRVKPFLTLEPYFRSWMQPETAFQGKTVLEIGAGELMASRLIASCFGAKTVVAVDLLWDRMALAFRADRKAGLVAVAGDCFKLPFRDGSFDVVFGNLVLCQLPGLEQVVREIRRILVPKGHYFGWEPNPFNPLILWRFRFEPHSPNQYLFWPGRFESTFQELGFCVERAFFYARWPRVRSRWIATCIGLTAQRDSK